ncbi:hypothetical protein [Salinispora vitiensis]|uniref:hypothetical protein n=1 Tax=Salinispora vitiensis TaxID=999544 RepID=UPI001CC728DB|nr:hypothetical protein [Salinispora vitiensis]
MTTQQTQGPTPGRARRHVVVGLLAAAVAVGTAATIGIVTGDPEPEPVQAASVANTDAGPVRCPEQRHEPDWPATPFAPEVMVPTGATEVLMCTYPTLGPEPWSLGSTRRNTSDVTELTDYINGLAISEDDAGCLMHIPPLRRSIVFGYAGQRAVTIHLGCAFWQREGGGASRYGGDQRKVLAYWGLTWNEH